MRAIEKGEKFIQENKGEAINIVSERLRIDKELTSVIWRDFEFRLMLDQLIVIALEEEARWAIRERLTNKKKVPNYFDFIYMDALEEVKPEAVTIIK